MMLIASWSSSCSLEATLPVSCCRDTVVVAAAMPDVDEDEMEKDCANLGNLVTTARVL